MRAVCGIAVLALGGALTGCAPPGSDAPVEPPAVAEKCDGIQGYAGGFAGRRTFLWRPAWLNLLKTGASERDLRVRIIARAEQALVGPAPTVTAKWAVPPSGDPHDYFSWPVYWWQTGLATYVGRDGEVNPESKTRRFDAWALREMQTRVTYLSLGYFLNGDPRFARKAAELLAVWFVDPATAINPNFNFSQALPGKQPRATIESTRLVAVVESIGLLQGSGDLSPELQQGLETWFSRYADWMTGPDAPWDRSATNNRALAYDLQLAEFALFARRLDLARSVIAGVPQARLAGQIAVDGRLPAETRRTHGLNYSLFALGLMVQLAELGDCVGVDLWSERENAPGIRKALDFLLPFAGHEVEWPYQESKEPAAIEGIRRQFQRILIKAGWAYREPRYFAAAALVRGAPATSAAWPAPLPDYLETP